MRVRVGLAAALTAAMWIMLMACGSGAAERAMFSANCEAECSQGVDGTICAPYCSCAYDWATENDRMDELEQLGNGGDGSSPVERDLMAACGSDLFDHEFMGGCAADCGTDVACRQRCECLLRELRGPGDRGESTLFLMDNLGTETTPAGQARIDAASAVCDPQP